MPQVRVHMLQLKILRETTKKDLVQPNKNKIKFKNCKMINKY